MNLHFTGNEGKMLMLINIPKPIQHAAVTVSRVIEIKQLPEYVGGVKGNGTFGAMVLRVDDSALDISSEDNLWIVLARLMIVNCSCDVYLVDVDNTAYAFDGFEWIEIGRVSKSSACRDWAFATELRSGMYYWEITK